MRRLNKILGLIVFGLLVAGCDAPARPTTPTPGQIKLSTSQAVIVTAAGQNIDITVELARSDKEHEVGLMGRESVPDGSGMLFIFNQPGNISFWMKDTKLSLSIAFIAADGKILDIQDMQAFSEDLHGISQPYQRALEVGQGWFARQGVKPGAIFKLKV